MTGIGSMATNMMYEQYMLSSSMLQNVDKTNYIRALRNIPVIAIDL